MANTYTLLSPVLDVVGMLPRLLTVPVAGALYYLGKRELANGRPYEAFFLLDASYRVSGNRLLLAQFAQIANLVELGQLDDALELKRWADGAVDRSPLFNDAARRYMRCYLNGLLPLHWHEIRQQPGEAVDPLSIDFKSVPAMISLTLKLNPKLVARFAPGMTIGSDANGVPVLFRARRDGGVPSVMRSGSSHPRPPAGSGAGARAPCRWTR
jgi:hypothetical protein